ncbi:MAG: N(4)-(Beta-N-acetylglucosaminyl)-L-asparaginase [Flavobacteriales bacterium]|nr:MAG: N(4)-(Beta-N-acetylglucosaminyl)-L-asparaginase [Flavobacteriales bacterium]|tara:strand:+ start:757 stop:1716 length:960 start_codon:yes stop_codon:yes gene_type:complete
MKRRNFIFDIFSIGLLSSITSRLKANNLNIYPMVRSISTWKTTEANLMAGSLLEKGVDALSAAVSGVAVEEENPKNTTVGYGGAPDRSGIVTLDACVMNHIGDCGSVIAVENIVNVARLAKDVMEKTPHVMLAGKGAQEFAISEGYKKEDLLTQKSKEDWKKWLESEDYKPIINIENHDTIGMLCLDKNNNISGACSTSGLAYKMKGRVGDSPIIGSGLFIDNKIGGAVATGLGEEVVKTVGSFLVVELMRQGKSPQEACESAVKRIVKSNSQKDKFQVAYIAINKNGEVGSYSIEPGFTYMDYYNGENKEVKTDSAFS